jgi:hypothetical protein
MNVYNYNPDTGEFTEITEARRSPADIEEVYLIPAHATTKEVLPYKKNFKRVFYDDKWNYVELTKNERIKYMTYIYELKKKQNVIKKLLTKFFGWKYDSRYGKVYIHKLVKGELNEKEQFVPYKSQFISLLKIL